MQYILHRRNSIEELQTTPTCYGIEVDVRTWGNKLILNHEPFSEGVEFAKWISHYQHGTLIVNVKEEGLEEEIMRMLSDNGISNFFFLDQSFPFLVKYSSAGIRNSAVRVSEFETVETALSLSSLVDWVWVDCFTEFPLDTHSIEMLSQARFKFCLVSPELQGRSEDLEIVRFAEKIRQLGFQPDAICTKSPKIWKRHYED